MTQTRHASDTLLREAVVAELDYTPDVDSGLIGVAVEQGTVTLFGEVNSWPEKLRAANATRRVDGVRAIAQELTVRATEAVSDSALAREAAYALEHSIDVPPSVTAEITDHIVRLTGTAQWHHQRLAAKQAVRNLVGVTEVISDIQIAVSPGLDIGALRSSIALALARSARLTGSQIDVAVSSSAVVTLTGTVSSWDNKRHADQISWWAAGVTSVTNHLEITVPR